MKRLHIIGRKNHGKTTLVVDLVREFRRRDLVVGTIKHTHHQHELDSPGKDSHHHRTAGADVAGILSRSMCALFFPMDRDAVDDPYRDIEPAFARSDIILVEGEKNAKAAKIEVWRASLDQPPKIDSDPSILAIVTDDSIASLKPVLARNNVGAIADWIEFHLLASDD